MLKPLPEEVYGDPPPYIVPMDIIEGYIESGREIPEEATGHVLLSNTFLIEDIPTTNRDQLRVSPLTIEISGETYVLPFAISKNDDGTYSLWKLRKNGWRKQTVSNIITGEDTDSFEPMGSNENDPHGYTHPLSTEPPQFEYKNSEGEYERISPVGLGIGVSTNGGPTQIVPLTPLIPIYEDGEDPGFDGGYFRFLNLGNGYVEVQLLHDPTAECNLGVQAP